VSRSLLRLPLALLFVLGGLAGCPTVDDDDTETPEPEPCQRPEERADPLLAVQGPEDAQNAGFAVPIVAAAADADGVALVTLYYRTRDGGTYLPVQMDLVPDAPPVEIDGMEATLFTADVPGNYVQPPGVDYYVIARDAGPCADESIAPEAAPEEANFGFDTVVVTSTIPLYSDFEGPECDNEEDIAGGWTAVSQRFPDPGHSWRNDDRFPHTGSCSVSHSEGVPGLWDCPPPDGEGTIERLNWLVSPALDFTTKEEIFLRWYERERESGDCAEVHSVYVSTGSPDPGDRLDGEGIGDYQLVATDLPLPTEEWSAADWLDLSEFAGNEAVYVAFVYQGGASDRWQIDDVYVGEPLADLVLDEIPTLDPTVEPGAAGITLDLVLRNESTDYPSPEVSALLTTDDPDLTITAATSTFPAIAVGETGAAADTFSFDIAATHPDNSYLDFTLHLDDGAGHLWALPIRLLMGRETFTTVATTPADLPLELVLGHGPFALPNYSEGTTTDAADSNPWTVNLTEQAVALPPGPGPKRWFLSVSNPGNLEATLDTWTFDVEEGTVGPDDLPITIPAGDSIVVRYPSPPILSVVDVQTTPDPAAPDTTVTIDSLTIQNDGASTVAGLDCVLDSAHPNVSGIGGGILTFGGTPVANGEQRALDQTPTFDISAAQTTDEPVDLVLLCTDGFDSLPVEFEIEVPWARPEVQGVLVDDSASACSGCSGDNDGYADPSETVAVYLTAVNAGSIALTEPLEATVTAGAGTVPFTLTNGNNISFGSTLLQPGETASATTAFTLGVDPSALLGDRMVIDVTFTSGADTWTDEFTIDVSGIPWLACNHPDDPMGDELGGTGLDLKSCDYRSDGTMLQVRVNSWVEFDPTIQPLWVLFYEAPSEYSVEFVPPADPVLEDGCLNGEDIFPTQLPLTVDNALTTSASVRIGLADLNELGNSLQVAFAAGFCLGFCDSYPDTANNWPSGSDAVCTPSQYIQINW